MCAPPCGTRAVLLFTRDELRVDVGKRDFERKRDGASNRSKKKGGLPSPGAPLTSPRASRMEQFLGRGKQRQGETLGQGFGTAKGGPSPAERFFSSTIQYSWTASVSQPVLLLSGSQLHKRCRVSLPAHRCYRSRRKGQIEKDERGWPGEGRVQKQISDSSTREKALHPLGKRSV